MARCSNCGELVNEGSGRCAHCGHELAVGRNTRWGRWAAILLLGVTLLALTGWVLFARLTGRPLLPGGASPLAGEPNVPCPAPTRNVRQRTPQQVNALLTEVKVYDHDDLDALACAKWYASDTGVQTGDGHLTLTGTGRWDAWWGTTRTFEQGDAVLVLFQYNPGVEFELHLERGRWGTDAYQRWALHTSHRFEMSIWDRHTPLRFVQMGGTLTPEPGAWYYALLAISDDAEFVAQVWPKEASSPYLTYRQPMGLPWAGGGWVLGAGGNRGQAVLDAVTELTFQGVSPLSEADARFWEGLSAYEGGELVAAAAAFDEALRLASDQASYHFYAGLTYWASAHPDQALAHLTQATTLDPGNDEYLRQLARFYASAMGDQAQALGAVEKALSLAPQEARSYDVRAMLRRDMPGQIEAALADFDRAITLAPTTAELFRHRGETLNQLGRYAEALQDSEQCIQLQPGDGLCYLEQARSFVGLGDLPAASAAYRLFLDLPRQPGCEGCEREAQDFIAAHPAGATP